MRSFRIRSAFGLPLVCAVVVGPTGASRVELVFDSGAVLTQLHVGTLESLGFQFKQRRPDLKMKGVSGKPQEGYSCQAKRFHLLGKKQDQPRIGAFDFADWAEAGIDGLLGWDLIQKLHLEMDGPRRNLKIF